MLAQKETLPQLLTYIFCVGVNVGLNELFIYGIPGGWAGVGFVGSAVATAASRWLQFIVMLTIVWYRARTRTVSPRPRAPVVGASPPRPTSSSGETRPLLANGSDGADADGAGEHRYEWSLRKSHSRHRLATFAKQAVPIGVCVPPAPHLTPCALFTLAPPCGLGLRVPNPKADRGCSIQRANGVCCAFALPNNNNNNNTCRSRTAVLEDGQLQLIAILAGRLGTVAAASNNGLFQVVWFLSSFMYGTFDIFFFLFFF